MSNLNTTEWTYKGQIITYLPPEVYGFVYIITNKTNNKIYIGKKTVLSKDGKQYKWRAYWSSCRELKADIKLLGEKFFTREIILFARNKAELTYYEAREQFKHGVIEPHVNSYNGNILGKFYKKIFYS